MNRGIINSHRKTTKNSKYWLFQKVIPNHEKFCGPYRPLSPNSIYYAENENKLTINDIEKNHDTIGMVVVDANKNVAAGTSTNGLRHKIAG